MRVATKLVGSFTRTSKVVLNTKTRTPTLAIPRYRSATNARKKTKYNNTWQQQQVTTFLRQVSRRYDYLTMVRMLLWYSRTWSHRHRHCERRRSIAHSRTHDNGERDLTSFARIHLTWRAVFTAATDAAVAIPTDEKPLLRTTTDDEWVSTTGRVSVLHYNSSLGSVTVYIIKCSV